MLGLVIGSLLTGGGLAIAIVTDPDSQEPRVAVQAIAATVLVVTGGLICWGGIL